MRKVISISLICLLVMCFSACNNIAEKTNLDVDATQNADINSESTNQEVDSSEKSSMPASSDSDNLSKENVSKPTQNDTVSSTLSNNGSDENQSETVLLENLNDFHNTIQEQNPAPDASVEFKPITDSGFSKGNGTQTNPYIITTAEELVYFSTKINTGKMNDGVHFALGADIDMTNVEFSPIGNGTHRFSSNFDGRGFVISNLTPKLIYGDYGNNANYSCGFFGIVGNAEIKNLRLENVNITYTYESNYFTEVGILAACVYPTRECKITDCVINGNINVDTDVLLAGGIVGDIFVTEGAKLYLERLQSNTKMQVRSDSVNAGAVLGSLLGRGEEAFSDICAQSEILHSSKYSSYIGAFGGLANPNGCVSISNCFFKINTNKKYNDEIHLLVGGIIDSYQPSGTFNFKNVFGFIDSSSELYEIPSENPVNEENCSLTDVLPSECNFNTEIWDISDPTVPFIKFNYETN